MWNLHVGRKTTESLQKLCKTKTGKFVFLVGKVRGEESNKKGVKESGDQSVKCQWMGDRN